MKPHTGTQTLETPRLVLRRFTAADAEAMFANWANDPAVTEHLTWFPHGKVENTRALLESCEAPEIFRLALPASSPSVIGAVDMLSQLHQMRLPKRMGSEKQAVEQAKRLLMRRQGLTEPEAHRAMQQYAMNHGMKMAEYAAQILETSRETEGH